MKRIRRSVLCWYLVVVGLACTILVRPVATDDNLPCNYDLCEIAYTTCLCVGPCPGYVLHWQTDFWFSTDCPSLRCYDSICEKLDRFPFCDYTCCYDYIRECM